MDNRQSLKQIPANSPQLHITNQKVKLTKMK